MLNDGKQQKRQCLSGVQKIIVAFRDEGMRLDRWFKLYVPQMSHIALQKALRKGHVRVDGKRAKASDRVEKGQEIRIPPVDENAPAKPHVKKDYVPSKEALATLKHAILFENKEVAIINKPQGLAVQGGSGQKQNVDAMLPFLFSHAEEKAKLVHRIDKDTTGLLIIAKTRKAAAQLTESFKKKQIQKRYLALVMGVPHPRQGDINLPLAKGDVGAGKEKMQIDHERGQKALSRYRVIDFAHQKAALVELEPVTGRTHQLRVHMAAIGHPIVGDMKYGGKEAVLDKAEKKLHLHAWQVELPPLPFLPKNKQFKAPLPPHLEAILAFLGLSYE